MLPGIEPMIKGDAIYLKNVSKMRGRVTLRTQHNTMSALADAVMTALFVNAVKQLQGFVT